MHGKRTRRELEWLRNKSSEQTGRTGSGTPMLKQLRGRNNTYQEEFLKREWGNSFVDDLYFIKLLNSVRRESA